MVGSRASPATGQLVPRVPWCLFPAQRDWFLFHSLRQRGLGGVWCGPICVSPKAGLEIIGPYDFCRNKFLLANF